ncbi:hypothetical protein [Nonomuraea candida]|uniref:hypothetical protein n=1 Tax=Nonomuraea candida TaxID=359159 RepID=UPI0005BA133E|nr:hypothetical protein [Nonomuraea candida]
MLTSRITAALVAGAVAATGLAAPSGAGPASAATALSRPGCKYRVVRVKTRLNVREQPRGEVVDKLYPGDRTWGSCQRFGKWRRIHGTEVGLRGFTFDHHLKKIGRR